MMSTVLSSKETVGERYELETMRHAQQMTWKAIDQIARVITPGMRESEAQLRGKEILAEHRHRSGNACLCRGGQGAVQPGRKFLA